MEILYNFNEVFSAIRAKLGHEIVMAIPLGIGKPNVFVNEIYKYACNHSEFKLTICTALTLEKPKGKHWIENRFINLFSDRIFGDYPDLIYENDRLSGKLPPNIEILEFYFPPGKYLSHKDIQKKYISSNYTHVCRDMLDRKVNLIAPMLAFELGEYSYSCNADVTVDLIEQLKLRKEKFMVIGQVNIHLPFMVGQALVNKEDFDIIIDRKEDYFKIFSPPKLSISDTDYMIGLYASALVKDDGELQVGIGSLGDAVVYALILKHQSNDIYKKLCSDFSLEKRFSSTLKRIGSLDVFKKGIFGATEMMVDGFMELYKAGILKKKVYDNLKLQGIINESLIDPLKLKIEDLKILEQRNIISSPLSLKDFEFLVYWGFLKEGLEFKEKIISRDDIGAELKHGHLMHAGFFIGPANFYHWLKSLSKEDRKLFDMRSVLKINQLYGHEMIDRLHRKNARFINTCMMTTLSGAHVSDGLSDGKIVSGVGGQFNFVAMAQELPDGHSIIMMKSTRQTSKGVKSNIVLNYGHITIPRHMRDILVTEYGIAFLRGKTDEEIIMELLNISDSRFQDELFRAAVMAGKLDGNYKIPEVHTHNFPESYKTILDKAKSDGYFPLFPFGTDLNENEIKIGSALKKLKKFKEQGHIKLMVKFLRALFLPISKSNQVLLSELHIDKPKDISEFVFKKLLNSLL